MCLMHPHHEDARECVLSDVSHLEFLISFDFEKMRQPVLRRALAMPERNRSAGTSCPSRNARQVVILLIKKEKEKKKGNGLDFTCLFIF